MRGANGNQGLFSMLTRFYADNFQCLVNFELCLDEQNVLLGSNGSGKTTVLEALRRIRSLVARGDRVDEIFPARDLSLTQGHNEQRFELDLRSGDGFYQYVVVIEHDRGNHRMRINEESLCHDRKPIFKFNKGNAQLFHDDYREGPSYPFDWGRSGIGALNARTDNTKVTGFRNSVREFIIASPCPPIFESRADGDNGRFDTIEWSMRNFVEWYRDAAQENMGAIGNLFEALGEAMPGFESMSLIEAGENSRVLKVSFRKVEGANESIRYSFSQLSDGQRMLVALYSLIFLSEKRPGLFLDEPDNYLALREIQPWLAAASERCGGSFEQLVIASHHPVTINYLGGASGRWFSRDGIGPVRVSDDPPKLIDGLTLSEVVARDWQE